MKNNFLVRNLEAGDLIENFLVSAISSILSIRLYLHLTNYPQVSFSNFHIAHVIWGGFLMMFSIMLLFLFINRHFKYIAAVVGGVGFGTFIDELGKFITQDNNYWYQPTIALLYILFVLLFLALRMFEKYVRFNSVEYAVNALEMVKEAVLHDMDADEKRQALHYLKLSRSSDELILYLSKLINQMETIPLRKKSIFSRMKTLVHNYYLKLTRTKVFVKSIIIFFSLYTIFSMGRALVRINEHETFLEWAELFSSSLAAVFVIVGIYLLRVKKRRFAFEFFRLSVLVSILLKQFVIFYNEQLSAILGLGVNIIVLGALQYAISEASIHVKKKRRKLTDKLKDWLLLNPAK